MPSGGDFILPTLMIVTDGRGVPVAPPEILEELDQDRVEQLLGNLIDEQGAPDRIVIGESDDWDSEGWRDFAEDYGVQLQFSRFTRRNGEEMRVITQKVVEFYVDHPPDRPESVAIAAGLVNTALRVRSESKKIALLKKAIDRDADCARARVELADAEFRRGGWKAALAAYDEVIDREFPRWTGRAARWWTDLKTRPYLRAIYGRAMTLWHQGHHLGAAETLSDLLELNPRDHQGTRILIPLVYMLGDDFETAQASFDAYEKAYPNDFSEPSFLLGWGVLHAYFGRDAEGIERFERAILKNIYVAPLLLDAPLPPEGIWFPNDRADPNYAREFVESYGVLWERVPAASRMLREAAQTMKPRIDEIVRLRSRMFDFQDQRYEPDYKRLWQELVAKDEELTA